MQGRLNSSAAVMDELHRLERVWSGPTNILPYVVLRVIRPGNENELTRIILFIPREDEQGVPIDFARMYTFYRCGLVTHDDPQSGFLLELFDDWKIGLEAVVRYAKAHIRQLRKTLARPV